MGAHNARPSHNVNKILTRGSQPLQNQNERAPNAHQHFEERGEEVPVPRRVAHDELIAQVPGPPHLQELETGLRYGF